MCILALLRLYYKQIGLRSGAKKRRLIRRHLDADHCRKALEFVIALAVMWDAVAATARCP